MQSEALLSREQLSKQLISLITSFSEEQHSKIAKVNSAVAQENTRAAALLKEDVSLLESGYQTILTDRTNMRQFVESGLADAEQRRIDNSEVSGHHKMLSLCWWVW
jgi:hypothetical protein